MRRSARSIFSFASVALLALAGCHKEPTTTAPQDEGCFGARCVEQAEAAMYYHDYDKAREPLQIVCDKGDGFQCFRLAELYHFGRGGPIDLEKAAQTYEKACAAEHGEGCERRADLAREGQGGPAVELEYAIKGCDYRRPTACTRAAEQLRDGRGVDRDDARACEYFELACGVGESAGCTSAGDIWSASTAKADAKMRALTAYIKGCVGHHPSACLKVGVAFHEGIGTKQDLDKAQQHFVKACEWGEQDGCHAAEQLKAAGGQPIELELTTRADEVSQGGLQVRELSCRMSQQGQPALNEVVASVARVKEKLDGCAKTGGAIGIRWEFEGGKVREAKTIDRGAKKLAGCVLATLKKARMPASGSCQGVLMLGDPGGATQALTARADKIAKDRERNTVHVGDEDEEE